MKDGGSVKEFARISSTKKTDSLTLRDIGKAITDITGEPMDELMELAGLLFLRFLKIVFTRMLCFNWNAMIIDWLFREVKKSLSVGLVCLFYLVYCKMHTHSSGIVFI